MKSKLITHLRSSLSTRLSLVMTIIVAAIFVTALNLMFSETREVVEREAMGKASERLEGTVLRIDNALRQVEVASNNLLHAIEENLDHPDKMFGYSRQMLESNPNLIASSIAFEPYYYQNKGEYFSAGSQYSGDSIFTEQKGNDSYQYHCMDWYLIPKHLNRPYWIEPFMESSTGKIEDTEIFTCFSQPIHDKKDQIVGVFTADISLSWLSKTVSATRPYPNSYSILLGKGGTFLVHPDSTRLFYETIFTRTLEVPDSAMTSLGEAMLGGESGHKFMHIDGQDCYVFYKPFKNTGWSVAIVCPKSDIFAKFYQLTLIVQILSVLGIVALLFLCMVTVKRSLKPLARLSEAASRIAEGQFNEDIPDSIRPDEIGQLQRNFKTMQSALSGHISEMRHQTESLALRNKELAEAYEQAKEDERFKTAILENMTDHMVQPVANISAIAHTICGGHEQLSNDYLNSMVTKMQDDANKVTELLNDLIQTASKNKKTDNQTPLGL